MQRLLYQFSAFLLVAEVASVSVCKITPSDAEWPSIVDWGSLNKTIGGTLINSTLSCNAVEDGWGLSYFYASLPESVNYPIYANNSCLPPTASGYVAGKGCVIGGAPQFVVNATTEQQVATAMKWASQRNIRIVIKVTGHEMNARSSGAYSLSIWTYNFKNIEFNSQWPRPGTNEEESVVIVGSGNNWGSTYGAAVKAGKIVVGGEDPTVGLGGYIQGGGHGYLSSTYGLAADQIFQVTIVTTEGKILTANEAMNQDLLWAVRGGGAGQYGVVTEYVLKAYSPPSSVVTGIFTMHSSSTDNASVEAAWRAAAILMSKLPDLMDSGFAGSLDGAIGVQSLALVPSLNGSLVGPVFTGSFVAYNKTEAEVNSIISPVIALLQAEGKNTSFFANWSDQYTYTDPLTFFNVTDQTGSAAGQISMMSSRLLGRAQLSDIPLSEVEAYLKQILRSESSSNTGYIVVGLQAGPGPAKVAASMRGALNPVWRSTYLHVISLGATIDTTIPPAEALASAAQWLNSTKETTWREWAPETGAYMNEANTFNTVFKHDYYGSSYDRLLKIKREYDPTASLFVFTGVGSDEWDYDLNTGKLCQV